MYYIYIEVTNQTTKKETATAMIHLYLDLVPESYSSTMDIIEFAQRVYTPDQDDVLEDLESEVWAEMRKDDEMPDFSEIYIKVVNNRGLGLLQTILPDANIQFDTDGSITIDGSSIYDSSYLTDAVSQYREDNTDEDEDEHED